MIFNLQMNILTIKASNHFCPKRRKGFALSNFLRNRIPKERSTYTELFSTRLAKLLVRALAVNKAYLKSLGLYYDYTEKMNNLFWPDENSIEQCFAAHIVQCCQQYCSVLLSLN